MRRLALVLLLIWMPATPAAAQCCGDCAGDGAVSIADLIVAVGNALEGCAEVTPTVGPSETPTRAPTPTRTPVRCPRNFTDSSNQCVFSGRYNLGCGTVVNAGFSVSGTTVVVAITTGLANPAVVRFAAQRATANRADLTGWSADNFQTVKPVAGQVELNGSGAELEVFPNDSPFMIQGCSFVQYLGAYLPPRAARADAAPDAAPDAALDLEALEAWQARPLPDLAAP